MDRRLDRDNLGTRGPGAPGLTAQAPPRRLAQHCRRTLGGPGLLGRVQRDVGLRQITRSSSAAASTSRFEVEATPPSTHRRPPISTARYDGGLGFGVTGDGDTAPDIGVLCAGIEHGVDALLAAARA